MPVCFSLTRKGDKEPTALQKIDAELCQNFETPFSNCTYTYGWYDDIGFNLALGKSWDEIADALHKTVYAKSHDQYFEHECMMLRFVHYLRQNYSPDNWREHK